jgi:hypothetical protein
MKKIHALAVVAVSLCAAGISTNAGAVEPINPAVARAVAVQIRPPTWIVSNVKGTIKVTPPTPTNPAGFNCPDLHVVASSKAGSNPGGGFFVPTWTRTGNGSGDWNSGSCAYEMNVPPSQEFNLTIGWDTHHACDSVVGLTASPWSAGPIAVAKGGTYTQNWTITGKPACEWIQ